MLECCRNWLHSFFYKNGMKMGNRNAGGGICMRINWTTEMENDLVELRQQGISWSELPNHMEQKYNMRFTRDSCRNKYRALQKKGLVQKQQENDPKDAYGIKMKKNKDGTIDLDQLIEVYSTNDLKDDEFVIKAHGFDPAKWDLVDCQFNMWNHFNKELPKPKTLYASKVKLKPKKVILDHDKLLKIV